MKTGGSLFRLPYAFLKSHHKILDSSKLVNFFLSEGGLSECPNFEGDGWKYKVNVEKRQFFQSTPDFPYFLQVVIHFLHLILHIKFN